MHSNSTLPLFTMHYEYMKLAVCMHAMNSDRVQSAESIFSFSSLIVSPGLQEEVEREARNGISHSPFFGGAFPRAILFSFISSVKS